MNEPDPVEFVEVNASARSTSDRAEALPHSRRLTTRRWTHPFGLPPGVARAVGALAALAIVVAVVVNTAHGRPDANTTPNTPANLTSVPASSPTAPVPIRPCAPSVACLVTDKVPVELGTLARALFPGAAVTSMASVFDADIPHVDVQQIGLKTAYGTLILLTQQRVGAAAPDTGIHALALKRGPWLMTADLSGRGEPFSQAVELAQAKLWLDRSALPS